MKKISTILAIVLCTILILGPLLVLKGMILPGESKNQDVRLHANTGNTTRINVKTPEELSLQISRILYPSTDTASKPSGYILIQSEQWQDIIAALPLTRSYNSTLISIPDGITPSIAEYIVKSAPIGIQDLQGTQLLVLSSKPGTLGSAFQQLNTLKSTVVDFNNTDNLADKVNKLPGNNNNTYGFVVADNDPLSSAPVASWMVNQGGALLITDSNGRLYPSSEVLLKAGGIKKVYIIGKQPIALEQNLINLNIEVQPITGRYT